MNKHKFEKLARLRQKLVKRINRLSHQKAKEVEMFMKTLKSKIGKNILEINTLELQILDC